MEACIRTVLKAGYGEYEEKRSRFICRVYPVSVEGEATRILGELKKKYWDARHHCFAYIIDSGTVRQRFGDDGEPSGTAGIPILEAIRKKNLTNVLVVVIRYFGGTLLGASGLVRAYGKAATTGLEDAGVMIKKLCHRVILRTEYHLHGKLQNIMASNQFTVMDIRYSDIVEMELFIELERKALFEKTVAEITAGKAEILFMDKIYADFKENGTCILSTY